MVSLPGAVDFLVDMLIRSARSSFLAGEKKIGVFDTLGIDGSFMPWLDLNGGSVHPKFVWLTGLIVRLPVSMQPHSHNFCKHQQRFQWQGVFAGVETKQEQEGAQYFATALLIVL
jgi:hypothetical protein